MAAEHVPSAVETFLHDLSFALSNKKVRDISELYEEEFTELTERFFSDCPWPHEDFIAPIVGGDVNLLVLYKELYFRHIYSRLEPTLGDRVESFNNYMELFNILLGLSKDEPEIELPAQWLWDIVDEFIFQFHDFHRFRTKVAALDERQTAMVQEQKHTWSVHTVVKFLMALISEASIDLAGSNRPSGDDDADADDKPATHPFFEILGHFALVGLCRVNVIMGDYTSALECLSPIDLREKRDLLTLVTAFQASFYYYLSFSYLMLRRYADAFRSCQSFLVYISRHKRDIPRNYQYKAVVKMITQMHGLIGICTTLYPARVDENIRKTMMEKHGLLLDRMADGDAQAFEELFSHCCPKFVNISPPFIAQRQNSHQDTFRLQRSTFAREMQQRTSVTAVFNELKLCSVVSVEKLASMLKTEEELMQLSLLCVKYKTRNLRWRGGRPIDGEWTVNGPVDFYVRDGIVHCESYRAPRRCGDYFIRQIVRLENQIAQVRSAINAAPEEESEHSGEEEA